MSIELKVELTNISVDTLGKHLSAERLHTFSSDGKIIAVSPVVEVFQTVPGTAQLAGGKIWLMRVFQAGTSFQFEVDGKAYTVTVSEDMSASEMATQLINAPLVDDIDSKISAGPQGAGILIEFTKSHMEVRTDPNPDSDETYDELVSVTAPVTSFTKLNEPVATLPADVISALIEAMNGGTE